MRTRCCLAGGYVHPDKVALLERLRSALEVPDRAEIWGRGEGYAWQLVSFTGWPLGVYGSAPIAETVRATLTYTVNNCAIWVSPSAD